MGALQNGSCSQISLLERGLKEVTPRVSELMNARTRASGMRKSKVFLLPRITLPFSERIFNKYQQKNKEQANPTVAKVGTLGSEQTLFSNVRCI